MTLQNTQRKNHELMFDSATVFLVLFITDVDRNRSGMQTLKSCGRSSTFTGKSTPFGNRRPRFPCDFADISPCKKGHFIFLFLELCFQFQELDFLISEVSFISNIYRLWFKCATPWRLWVIFTVWVSAEGEKPSQMKTETLGAVGSSFLDTACDPDAPTASLSGLQMVQWSCVILKSKEF